MSEPLTPPPAHRRSVSVGLASGVIGVALVLIYGAVMLLAPVPAVSATSIPLTITAPARPAIAWPGSGQAAVGVNGSGVVATNGAQTGVPIASIAKLVLALSVVAKQPITPGQPGTTITFTDADEQLYRDKIKENQSVVPIATGEQLTEYQALQALLLPSGNNIADSLAIRAFGSVSAYVTFANQQVSDWGLTQTHLDDASGFSPKTVSSAHDLVLLGEKVLANPVLAEIVKQSDVKLPVAGDEHNVDTLLGTDGIIGIKTGNTDQAGGCFLFASQPSDSSQPIIIGAFLGLADLPAALSATTGFIEASAGNFAPVTVVPANQAVATYQVPWGRSVDVLTKTAATSINPTGTAVTTSLTTPALTAAAQGTAAGTLQVKSGDATTATPLVLAAPIPKPSVVWKLLHPMPELSAIKAHLHR